MNFSSFDMSPEQMLWHDALMLAITDLSVDKRYRKKRDGTGAEKCRQSWSAKEWILSDCKEPSSFIWVCHSLGLSDAVIKRIKQMAEKTPDYRAINMRVKRMQAVSAKYPENVIDDRGVWIIKYDGRTGTIAQWSKWLGLKPAALTNRLYEWTLDQAINTPVLTCNLNAKRKKKK